MITHLLDQIKKPFDIITESFDDVPGQMEFSHIALVYTEPENGDVYVLFSLSGDTFEFEYNETWLYDGMNHEDLTTEDDEDGAPYRLATAEEKKTFLDFLDHNRGFLHHIVREKSAFVPRSIFGVSNMLRDELEGSAKSQS